MNQLIAYLIAGAVILAAFGSTYWAGMHRVQKQWDEQTLKAEEHVETLAQAANTANTKTLTVYKDRVVTITKQGDTIEKLVPIYVPATDITVGTARLLNAVTTNQYFESIPGTDGQTANITLDGLVSSVIGNYTICRQNAEQLTALQTEVESNQLLGEQK